MARFNRLLRKTDNDRGDSYLHLAVYEQDASLVKMGIKHGFDVNKKNNVGAVPLTCAINLDNPEKQSTIMKMLVEAGSFVNNIFLNKSELAAIGGKTPLLVAVANGDIELVQLLINKGANVYDSDTEGWTALHCAAHGVRDEDPRIFEILIRAGAEVDARNKNKETALHLLAGSERSMSFRKIFSVFVKNGADFNAQDKDGRTPMDVAVDYGKLDVVEGLVVTGGVSINSEYTPYNSEKIGETILHAACRNVDLAMVKFLLDKGANVSVVDKNGVSPLQRVLNDFDEKNDTVVDLEKKYEVIRLFLKLKSK